MNVKNAKFLVLGGFVVNAILSGFNFILNLTGGNNPDINLFTRILGLGATLGIVMGFAFIFLATRDPFNLLITGGFAITVIPSLLYVLFFIAENITLIELMTATSAVSSIVYIFTLLLWAFKFYRVSNVKPALAIAGAVLMVILTALLSSVIPYPVVALLSVAENAALAFAAFIDYQS